MRSVLVVRVGLLSIICAMLASSHSDKELSDNCELRIKPYL